MGAASRGGFVMAQWSTIAGKLRRKPSVALAVAGLCVGLTNLWLRGGHVEGVLHLLTVWFFGYMGSLLVLVIAYPLAAWYLGDKAPSMDTTLIIIAATLVSVCAWLLLAHAGPFGFDDSDWSGYDPY
jgi:hypothetical protein